MKIYTKKQDVYKTGLKVMVQDFPFVHKCSGK